MDLEYFRKTFPEFENEMFVVLENITNNPLTLTFMIKKQSFENFPEEIKALISRDQDETDILNNIQSFFDGDFYYPKNKTLSFEVEIIQNKIFFRSVLVDEKERTILFLQRLLDTLGIRNRMIPIITYVSPLSEIDNIDFNKTIWRKLDDIILTDKPKAVLVKPYKRFMYDAKGKMFSYEIQL